MIVKSNYRNYREFFYRVKADISNLLALGCGTVLSEVELGAKHVIGVEWSDRRLAVAKEKLACAIKYDFKDICDILPDKSFDVATMFDALEHLEKDDGLKLLKGLEKKIRDQIIIFVPVQGDLPRIEEYRRVQAEDKANNLALGNHLSTWLPEDFEKLGYQVIEYSPNYHSEKGYGAVFCIKNL